jgi:WD40 repeat protein
MATSFLKSLARSLRTVLQRLLSILETPLMYLFGRDIFISYARSDAANYAQNLAIDLRTHVPQFSFFLDQWASASGTTLPLALRLALRWSQLLVFVGTQNAIDSPHVRKELQAFFNRKGRFVPIDVGGALDKAMRSDQFMSAICGPGAVREIEEKVSAGTPSPNVVTRIVNAVNFTRQDRRLRRAVAATTVGVVAIIGTASFVSWRIISNAQARADEANRQAQEAAQQADIAKGERQQALQDLSQAQIDTEQAKGAKTAAEKLAEEANEQAELAKNMRVAAERLRDQARAEAARQSNILLMRHRANQSELMLQRNPTRLADSVSLAIESMKRAHAAGIHSLEADRALRGSLSLLPRSLGSAKTIDDVISVTAFSPDGKNLAVLSRTGSSDGASVLRIVNGDESREIGSIPKEWRHIALSNDSRRIAISSGQTVQTRDVSGSGSWKLETENDDYVTGLALSPNGKYIALIKRNPYFETRGFADVWEVETGKFVAQLKTDTLDMKSVAFSADGRLLAIGGGGFGPRGKRMGRVFVWTLGKHAIDGTLSSNHFAQRDELFQNEEIDAIAIGRDDRFVATASGQLAVVWKKSAGGYFEIARMPIERRIDELAFTPDGKYLHVLSGGVCQEATVDCRRRFLETWEATGYWQALTAPYSDAIESIAFQSGDKFIAAIINNYSDDNRRFWQVSDGAEVKNLNERSGEDVRSSPAVRYFVNEDEDGWYVSDTLSGAKIPVTTAGVAQERLEHPSLTRDGSLLAFGGKKKGESGFSVFLFRRGAASYVFDRGFPMAGYPASLAISPDKVHVAVSQSVNYKTTLRVFDIEDGRDRILVGIPERRDVDSFEFAPDGKTLAVLFEGRTKSVGVWRLLDGRQNAMLESTGEIPSYSFNAAGDRLAVAMKQETVELLDLRSGKVIVLPTNRPIRLVAFSPDGRFLATADAKGLVTLFQLSNLDEVANFQHENNVSQIVFSSDGKYLATASRAEEEDAAPPDEKYLLHVWLLRPEDLIKEACQRLTRFRETELLYCSAR